MDLSDDKHFGELVDEVDSDTDQSTLNEILLKEHDARVLFESISKRISQPYLNFILNSINLKNMDYWNSLLKEIAKVYNLNYLKLSIDGIFDNSDNSIQNILSFIIYLKVRLIYFTELNKINKDISRADLEIFLQNDKAPPLMIECIKYIDSESYKKFMNRLFLEKQMDFIE